MLTITVLALGVLAALLVLATLALVAVDGHPEGLLCVVAGAAVPALLWGAWRLAPVTRDRFWSPLAARILSREPPPASTDPEVTPKAEVTVVRQEMSTPAYPSDTIFVELNWT